MSFLLEASMVVALIVLSKALHAMAVIIVENGGMTGAAVTLVIIYVVAIIMERR